jgi:hypothetical protein
MAAAARAQSQPNGTFIYGIHHEKHGDIGSHKLSFSRNGDNLLVEVENRIEVKVLFMTFFSFAADRREIWRGGRMLSYRSQTDDDGTDIAVRGVAKGDRFVIDGPDGQTDAPAGVFPSNPWNRKIVEQPLLMDSKSGALLKVKTEAAGAETVEARGGQVEALKFVMSGDLARELWFAEDGTWLKMRFDSDGAAVTFTLR